MIGSRADAMEGAAREAEARGYRVIRIDEPIVGEARLAADAYIRQHVGRPLTRRQSDDVGRPFTGRLCLISSGETTVRVTGAGKGGRNQEFALAAAASYGASAFRRTDFVLVSVGTDGIDGPTDAAGAIVDPTTLDRARAAGLDPARFLDANDAYTFFDRLGDLIKTGPTNTNVGDIQVLLL